MPAENMDKAALLALVVTFNAWWSVSHTLGRELCPNQRLIFYVILA